MRSSGCSNKTGLIFHKCPVSLVIVSDKSGAKGGGGISQRLKLREIRGSGADIQLRKEPRTKEVKSFRTSQDI